jgi:hypothetical protein
MKKKAAFVILFLASCSIQAQDLLAALDTDTPTKDYTIATFKGTRLINFHTNETLSKGTLEFRIAHRFGAFSTGLTNLYGLDGPATIQLRLDYAFTNRLMAGFGRSSDQKMLDAFVKYRLLRQTINNTMPISLTGLFSTNLNTFPNANLQDPYASDVDRLSYLYGVILAKKFSPQFSLQVTPMFTHFNIVNKLTDKNDLLSLEGSLRYKFSKRAAITIEYMKRITPYTATMNQYYDVLGIGFDIETGGHVFQVFVTNGSSINEARTIAYSSTSIAKGMALGFNISRVFSVGSKK